MYRPPPPVLNRSPPRAPADRPATSTTLTGCVPRSKRLPVAVPRLVGGGLLVAGLLLGLLVEGGYWLGLAIIPLYLMYHTHRVYLGRIEEEQRRLTQTTELQLATIEALARAIDAKEQLAHNHPWRVQFHAARLSRALGLTDQEIHGIRTAALLHDIGKLAVPEHILSKPEPLTTEELATVRTHSQIGAEIIAGVPFPYPVAAAILGHHERWDGTGYPHQLKGEAIPLGARILSVVDLFVAVTSQRAYGEVLTDSEAAALLARESGSALDPRLVAIFLALLPSLLADQATLASGATRDVGPAAGPASSPGAAPNPPEGVFEHIALAHREIHALYEIAQSMSTGLGVTETMALISSKLTKIVPWSGCSLFVYHRSIESLTCAFAAGLDIPHLIGRTIPIDANVADWVGGQRRTLLNADPRAIFEAVGAVAGTELKSALVCPLYFADTFVGVFSVYDVKAVRYTEDHRRLFERVAEQTGTALHNSIVFEQTRDEALTDQLTSLPNRRWLGRYLPQELSRAERPPAEVALIAIDIDDFKSINDLYGHDVGDRALRAAADALLNVCRSYDVCARLAGDEFVVLLPNCSREAAELRREELQQRIASVTLDVHPNLRLQLHASAGVSVFPHDGRTSEALLDAADRRMYEDKAAHHLGGHRPKSRQLDGSVENAGALPLDVAGV